MILRAYIGDDGCIDWQYDQGTSTFAQIFVRRPRGYRYAIAEMRNSFVSVDMFEGLMMCVPLWDHIMDKRAEMGIHRHFPTRDAAIMATMMTYNTGDTLDGKSQKEIEEFIRQAQDCPDCQW